MADREREGYVLVDRNILNWQLWQNHNVVIIFMWLLLKAQFHKSHFCGVEINRGEVATTVENIGFSNNFTRQEVRTALNKLKSTGVITITRHSKFQVITIVNYEEYQNLTMKSTINQPSSNHHLTINQPYTNTYNTLNTSKTCKRRSGRSAPVSDFPETEEEIDFDRDLGGLPKLEDIPCEADGSKRDIPERVRHLFGYYGAYWRYIERCNTK